MQLHTFLLVISSFWLCAEALYEDQVGKFDWRKQLIGRPVRVLFGKRGTSTGQRLVVATEQNVLASLNPKTGDLLWRRVFEKEEAGQIHQLLPSGDQILTFSGQNLLRLWNGANGLMISETQLSLPKPKGTSAVFALTNGPDQLTVVHLAAVSWLHTVSRDTGEVVTSRSVSTPWVADHVSCVSGEAALLCWDHGSRTVFSYSTSGPAEFTVTSLPTSPAGRFQHVGGDYFSAPDAASGRLTLLQVTSSAPVVQEMAADVVCATETDASGKTTPDSIYTGQCNEETSTWRFGPAQLTSGSALPSGPVTLTRRHGRVSACHVTLVPRAEGGAKAALALLIGADDAVTMAQIGGGVYWSREEALASILAVELVDLPMSSADVSIEEEFDMEGGPVSAFVRRVTSQWSQLTALVTSVPTGHVIRGDDVTHLTRDPFNLHKMIVVATACGKLFGLHSETGAVVWAVPLVYEQPISAGRLVLGLQRGTAHFPHPPIAVLLTRRRLVLFNPITGGDLDLHDLDYQVNQGNLLQVTDTTHLKPLVILDTAGRVHVWPDSGAALVRSVSHKLFFYTADVATGLLQGYSVSKTLGALPSWRVDLGSQGQQLVQLVGKSPQERVHSQGRVMGDRSVLYKYSNPNLLALITQSDDPVHKHSVTLYLLDAVTGHVTYSHVQRRVRCPCHVVHSENWLVYSVYNEKARRTEITSLELFEGKSQSNDTAFSSLEGPPQPMVERQTYIFPTQIEAMRETITEKGITTKFILFALPSGRVVELNRILMDPRRPLAPSAPSLDEGLPPYMPELPLPSVAVINYNRTLLGVRSIHTAPSGLESTSLVFIYGLDLFKTRVFPSKMFDQLKDDFDSSLIVLVLAGLTLASLVTRRLAQRRALQQAWK